MPKEKIKTLTLDLETENLDPYHNKILLIAYRYNGTGPVFQVKVYEGDKPDDTFLANLADPSIIKRGHNTHFDLLCLAAAGYMVRGPIDDTRILAYLEDPYAEIGLKKLVETKLNREVKRLEDFGLVRLNKETKKLPGLVKAGKVWIHDTTKPIFEEYNKADVINCDDLRSQLITTDWYTKVEQPLSRILFEAEALGMQLDIKYLERLKNEFTQQTEEYKEKLGKDFNPNSPTQVKAKFKTQGIDLDTTDKYVLKQLSWKGNTFAKYLLQYRGLSKLLGTYVNPFLKQSIEGRLHGRFNQAGHESSTLGDTGGTATGRLSSSDPNLQNISSRTEDGKKVRKAFIAKPGLLLINSDLKQIEPRLIAHFSQSKKLLNAYAKGLDTHAIMGADIFNKRPDQLTKLERFIGKTSWLADVYGCWYPKLRKIIEINSDEPLFYEDEYYKKLQDAFWQSNSEIANWRETLINQTKGTGNITTIGGRIIKIPGINSHNKWEAKEAERMAVNYLIQGSAADIMKLILVELDKKLSNVFLLATIHDEVLMETSDPMAVHNVDEIMSTTVKLNNVQLEADSKIIKNWSEK